jgi:hypothetical protein
MTDSLLWLPLDPADCTPQERARAVAAILAAGLLRLHRPAPLATHLPPQAPENSLESRANRLAVPPEKSVTVTAG